MSEWIKSPINYIGNKYKLLPQIIPLFPKEIDHLVDLFGGSGTVLINTKAEHYIYNDINNYVAEIFEGLVKAGSAEEIIEQVEAIIKEYSLSMTNKEGFEKLRDDYNKGRRDWITLYTLMCHSFNHQFRFNSNHEYNSSFGKNRSYFSERQKQDLIRMKEKSELKDVEIHKCSFEKCLSEYEWNQFSKNDLVYCDPPYLSSVGNYNDGKRGFEGWTPEHERKLLSLLTMLDNNGVRFALSNNFKYDNSYLQEWLDENKFNTLYLHGDYVNCNYHKKDRSKDIEVLITNY